MIKIYRKTATIKAEQFDGGQKLIDKYRIGFMPAMQIDPFGDPNDENNWSDPAFKIQTLEGVLQLRVGDWIATGVNGEHWPIADDVFKKTYAELPVIPKVWADTIEEYKANHYRLDEIFTEWSWNYDEQELIARAWLDGYQVEAQHDTRAD
ncbi:DUF1642 domain-containing protein [Levilactobacillus brevis]|uniref:DUF1642 domain-containing protein n=1 Tax=Levilactobacillus brevis TaxID=1580 RepID=UPI002073211A|nr:DUF1642 domain-containing protein [Levilactobacillus brevis]